MSSPRENTSRRDLIIDKGTAQKVQARFTRLQRVFGLRAPTTEDGEHTFLALILVTNHNDGWNHLRTVKEIFGMLRYSESAFEEAEQARYLLLAVLKYTLTDARKPGWLRTLDQIDGLDFEGPFRDMSNPLEIKRYLLEYYMTRQEANNTADIDREVTTMLDWESGELNRLVASYAEALDYTALLDKLNLPSLMENPIGDTSGLNENGNQQPADIRRLHDEYKESGKVFLHLLYDMVAWVPENRKQAFKHCFEIHDKYGFRHKDLSTATTILGNSPGFVFGGEMANALDSEISCRQKVSEWYSNRPANSGNDGHQEYLNNLIKARDILSS